MGAPQSGIELECLLRLGSSGWHVTINFTFFKYFFSFLFIILFLFSFICLILLICKPSLIFGNYLLFSIYTIPRIISCHFFILATFLFHISIIVLAFPNIFFAISIVSSYSFSCIESSVPY